MDIDKIVNILEICLPVFGMIAMGKIFQLKGIMQQVHREFVNKLVYYFCLPALVFVNVAGQDPSMFHDPALLAGAILPTLGITVVFLIIAKITGMKGGFAAAFIFGAFYANSAYMGFPIAEEAFGKEGLGVAAIINAMCIPSFMIIAFVIIGYYGAGDRVESFASRLKKIILNPFILACIVGGIVAYITSEVKGPGGEIGLPGFVISICGIIRSFLTLVAKMGLPLALLAIGGVLHLGTIKRSLAALGADIFGKLILVPTFTLLVYAFLFPQTSPTAAAVAVLIHAMPNAVVSYVIACQIGVDEGFVSAQLVLSTVLSAITIPVWIYILM